MKPRPGVEVEAHSEAVFAKACELDLEGVVGKHDDSSYQRGKRPTWVKTKNSGYSRKEVRRQYRACSSKPSVRRYVVAVNTTAT